MKKQIPNLFTLLNLFFGCLAIVFALQTNTVIIYVNDQFNSSFNIPEKITWAAICIMIAAVIDFLDGFVARLLKATSEMGKQLDSLSDVVSFGVAPAVIVYQLLKFSFAREENGLDISTFWLMPAFILLVRQLIGLLNSTSIHTQAIFFQGSSCSRSRFIGGFFSAYSAFQSIAYVTSFFSINGFLLLILVLSYLMVSNIRMMSLKFPDFTFQNNIPKIILLVIAIIAAVFLAMGCRTGSVYILCFIIIEQFKN